ncbi:hypothetical protein PG994_009981 [Apiospora phragmitis]|uniref:Uncharacterized protein n=1 Tax=Apiospora phragmitis TaxID=2905665 RepID=A0ABR1TNL3_9PEZI
MTDQRLPTPSKLADASPSEPTATFVLGQPQQNPALRRRKRGSQSPTKRSSNTTSTKSTALFDRTFQQHLIDFSVLPGGYEYPDGDPAQEPANLGEIARVLAQPQPSLSALRFPDEDFRRFKREENHASKE